MERLKWGVTVQCIELKLRWQFCEHGSTYPEIYFQSKFWIFLGISNAISLLRLAQKHICNIFKEIVYRICTCLLFARTISLIMFHICFPANHSQHLAFKISKIIQNFDYRYISGHVLLCTQNCHLNPNSTHCGGTQLAGFY